MIEAFYFNSLFAGWVLLLFFGSNLLFSKIPKKPLYEAYKRSRHILGVDLLIWGLQLFIQWQFDFRDNAPQIATALNLSCYYLAALLFGMAFISLLNSHYINRRLIYVNSAKWLTFIIVIWSSVLWLNGTPQNVMLILCAIFFFADACYISITFFRTYQMVVRKVDNYYSESVAGFIQWISQSVYGVIFFGLIGSVLAFAPKWAIAIYMFCGIFMFCYIFICFQNYLVNFEQVETVVSEPESTTAQVPTQINGQLEEKLQLWIDNAGYKQQGITIEQLAIIIGTNRTYLSNHINTTYNCSFREWISLLRIEEAKRLLKTDSDTTIAEVAFEVGFSSASHLTHLFTQYEKKSPSQWRKKHTKDIHK